MKKQQYRKTRYILFYSFIYLILAFFCFGIYMLLYKKSILRPADTFDQQYITFIKIGQWIRDIIRGRKVLIWDPSIGYGADLFLSISASNQGSIFDPILWLSVFTPVRYAEIVFTGTVFLRLYLSGLSFSLFAFKKGCSDYAVLCGAIVYTFCACAYVGMYQTHFILPLYVFPLILYGVEELYENGRSSIYIAALTATAIWSFYFVYMIAITVVVYVLLKWIFADQSEHTLKRFGEITKRFAFFSVLSAGISAFVLFPVAKHMLSMDRLKLENYVPLLYDKSYYLNLLAGFTGTFDMLRRDCKVGYSIFALIAVAALFTVRKKELRLLKAALVLSGAVLCLPVGGHIMNGFAYASNRWVFVLAFLLSYTVTVMLPEFRHMKRTEQLVLLFLIGSYYIAVFCFCGADFWKYGILAVFTLAAYLMIYVFGRSSEIQYRKIMTGLVCISVIIPAYFQMSQGQGDQFGKNLDAGSAYERATQEGGLPLLKEIDLKNGERFNSYGLDLVRNAGWLYGISGENYYMSGYNSWIDRFHNSIALRTSPFAHLYDGLDRRSELLALTAIGHVFVPSENPYHPVGFGRVEAETTSYGTKVISLAADTHPSVFLEFEKAISYSEYDDHSPFERQQILTQACVVEDERANYSAKDLKLEDNTVEFSIEKQSEDLNIKGQEIEVFQKGAQIELVFPELKDAELYLYFENIEYVNNNDTEYTVRAQAMYGEEMLPNADFSFRGLNRLNHMDGGKRTWLLNLGRHDQPCDRIRITFNNAGRYRIKDVKVYARPETAILENIGDLSYVSDGVEFGTNSVRVKVENETPKYLFASIPYSEGWTVTDQGKKLEILRADEGFLAVQLSEGVHDLCFTYRTPGFTAGLLVSLISLLCLTVGKIVWRW